MAVSVDAASLIRDGRERAGLSQTELARRAGVTQPVVSEYETGRRQPSLPMLLKLVEASGHDVEIQLVHRAGEPEPLPSTATGRRIRRCRGALVEAARRRGASNLRLFGSAARGDDTATSDVDLLVDLAPGSGLLTLIGLQRELTEILGIDVDLVPASGLKAELRDHVLSEAIPL